MHRNNLHLPTANCTRFLVLLCLLCTLGAPAATLRPVGRPAIAGIVTDPALGELSGLAASRRARDRYWAINDGGNGNRLVLIDGRGHVLRQYTLTGAENIDWEDLASFRWRDRNWLLIADTGDNSGVREHASLWLLPEPALNDRRSELHDAREIRFRYPDTPHDVEAMTVDPVSEEILLLTKRTVPPVLFSLPLATADSTQIATAKRVVELGTIPQPTESEILRDGKLSRFRSQITAVDLDCAGRSLLVLTYDALYRFARERGQSWEKALATQEPGRSQILFLPQAEALSFDKKCRNLLVGSEKAPVPLLRFRYRALPEPAAQGRPAQAPQDFP